MTRSKSMKLLRHPVSLAVIATIAIAGCATRQTQVAQGPAWMVSSVDYTASPTGAQGAMVGTSPDGSRWYRFRDYTFDSDGYVILRVDHEKAREVAEYLNNNPDRRVAIDGNNRERTAAIRDALLSAGVPAHKIVSGDFVDSQFRTRNNVYVMIDRKQ